MEFFLEIFALYLIGKIPRFATLALVLWLFSRHEMYNFITKTDHMLSKLCYYYSKFTAILADCLLVLINKHIAKKSGQPRLIWCDLSLFLDNLLYLHQYAIHRKK